MSHDDDHHAEFSKAFNYFQKEFAKSEGEEAEIAWSHSTVNRWANMAVK